MESDATSSVLVAEDATTPYGAQTSLDNTQTAPSQKYLVVTGGTLSGVGKGTTISCIGVVLKSMGFRVTAIKIDPYLNVDAGTMSPYEHGEVYVLEDGGEADLDLGNYERFLDVTLTSDHNITTGKIYEKVLRDERAGRFLGKTVQVVPHVTDTIQNWIRLVAQRPVDSQQRGSPDICLIEVGGTVGDIESSCYLEALQQFYSNVGSDNFCLCHVSYVPEVGSGANREQKTKPTQHSVKELRQRGLRPDFIFCRSDNPLDVQAKNKIALFGQVPPQHVIAVNNIPNIYRAPAMIDQQNFGILVCKKLGLVPSPEYLRETGRSFEPSGCGLRSPLVVGEASPTYSLSRWRELAEEADKAVHTVKIGIVGKYTGLGDSYLSVLKALNHAALAAKVRLEIVWIESSSLESEGKHPEAHRDAWANLKRVHGVLCPGGFGDRGILGKMASATYCRTHKVPYFGICLGMQTAVIEFCRNELGLTAADSEEFNKDTPDKVVVFMPEIQASMMGGTMRLGNRATIIRDPNSIAFRLYGNTPVIYERHRHRYEVNSLYVQAMEAKGLRFVGQDERGQRMEIAELANHPYSTVYIKLFYADLQTLVPQFSR